MLMLYLYCVCNLTRCQRNVAYCMGEFRAARDREPVGKLLKLYVRAWTQMLNVMLTFLTYSVIILVSLQV